MASRETCAKNNPNVAPSLFRPFGGIHVTQGACKNRLDPTIGARVRARCSKPASERYRCDFPAWKYNISRMIHAATSRAFLQPLSSYFSFLFPTLTHVFFLVVSRKKITVTQKTVAHDASPALCITDFWNQRLHTGRPVSQPTPSTGPPSARL